MTSLLERRRETRASSGVEVAVAGLTADRRIVLEGLGLAAPGWRLPRGRSLPGEPLGAAACRVFTSATGESLDSRLAKLLGRVRLAGGSNVEDLVLVWVPTGLVEENVVPAQSPPVLARAFSLVQLRHMLVHEDVVDGAVFAAIGLLAAHGIL